MASTSTRSSVRTTWVAIRLLVLATVVTGIAYPLAVTGVAQLAFPGNANGSLVTSHGQVVGSARLGQSTTTAEGAVIATWFQSRPSAAGDGYDANASSGSNLGPTNPALVKAIRQRRAAVAAADGVPVSQVPADAVTASGSGLDPDISPAAALQQVDRVATARGLSEARVRDLVEAHVQGRQLGFLGEPRVNVLELNLAVAALR